MTDVADVQMAREKQIRARCRELRHRHRRTAEQTLLANPFRQIERMVRDHNPDQVARRAGQMCDDIVDLAGVDPAFAPCPRSRGVHANHNHFLVAIDR